MFPKKNNKVVVFFFEIHQLSKTDAPLGVFKNNKKMIKSNNQSELIRMMILRTVENKIS